MTKRCAKTREGRLFVDVGAKNGGQPFPHGVKEQKVNGKGSFGHCFVVVRF